VLTRRPLRATLSSIAARRPASSAAPAGAGRRLIWALLISAAVLDLTRCSLVLLTVRHLAVAVGLISAGMAAAAVSVAAAWGYQAGRRWAILAAVVVGVGSPPLASASGFRAPFTILDVAASIVGIVLAVAVLAAIGPGTRLEQPTCACGASPPDQLAAQAKSASLGAGHGPDE
jgi:hypothetical protein